MSGNTYDQMWDKLHDPNWDSTGICQDIRNRLFRDGDLEAAVVIDWLNSQLDEQE